MTPPSQASPPPLGTRSPDLVVVGAGIVGLGIARNAARRGLQVVVLEKDRPGSGASRAAAGMLSPLAEAPVDGPFLDFALASLHLWPDWAHSLGRETGVDLQFEQAGKLRVALDEAECEALKARIPWAGARGLGTRWLDAEAVQALEPGLCASTGNSAERASSTRRASSTGTGFRTFNGSGAHSGSGARILGGLLLDEDFRVDNRQVVEALLRSARDDGVDVRCGTEVEGILSSGGRVEGVATSTGRVRAGAVLVAAGAWSARVRGLPADLPIHPVRGQMLALRPSPAPHVPIRRTIETDQVYLVPRADGRILVGATVEPDAGFSEGVTAEGIRWLLKRAIELVPGLAEARLTETWSGLRPGTADGLPIMGKDPALKGLWLAAGHYRNGVLLAPATAEAMGALIAGEGSSTALPSAFAPARFRTVTT